MSMGNSWYCCCNCQSKHHISLCTNEQYGYTSEQSTQSTTQQNVTVISQPSAAQQNVTTTSQNLAVTNHPSTITSAKSASLSVTAPPPQNAACLLKTAVATIRHGPNHTRASLMFDEGSQRSFITESLVTTLALQSHCKKDITTLSFRAQHQLSKQINVAVVHLVTPTGQAILLTVLHGPSYCHAIAEYSEIWCSWSSSPPEASPGSLH